MIVRASVRRHRSGQPHITVKLYALSRHLASKIAIAAAYRRAARPSSPACIKADLAKWKKAIEDAKIPRIGG